MKSININELANALIQYKVEEGWCWKYKLQCNWENGDYKLVHSDYKHLLQQFRNKGGLEVLDSLKSNMTAEEIEQVLKTKIPMTTNGQVFRCCDNCETHEDHYVLSNCPTCGYIGPKAMVLRTDGAV